LVNPGSEVTKKLNKSKFLDEIGHKWVYVTVEEAVGVCSFMLHTHKANNLKKDESEGLNSV
jgi:sulfate transporter 3